MKTKSLVRKTGSYLVLGAILTSTALSVAGTTTAMAEAAVNPQISQLLNEGINETSAVVYVDGTGEHILPVSEGSVVKLSATATTLNMTIDGKNHKLKGVQEITFKGITVDRLIPFYLNGVTKVTLDTVNFSKGVDFSGMKNLETLVVKNSTFGSSDYSLAIHTAPVLKTFAVDNSTFGADVRIYNNKELEMSSLSNSVFMKDVKQYSNKKGYFTDLVNNRFERSKVQRVINSGGMSKNDVFYINKNDSEIGNVPFDETKDGYISYVAGDEKEKIEVPAGVKVTSVTDAGNKITIKLSNGETYQLEGSQELNFRNVDITTHVAFTQPKLELNKLTFTSSRTRLIDVAYSKTMTQIQVIDTEISQSTGYLSIYNNKAIQSVEIQNSVVTGSSGYVSVYNNTAMSKFVMNNVYTHGYVSAYNLGGTVLQISNSLFDDYISTNQVIEGEGEPVIIGSAPVIEGPIDVELEKGDDFELLDGVTANDAEDGDLTALIAVEGNVNTGKRGVYPITYSVTDSDGNTTIVTINVTIV